jgi:hypothetical protein
MSSFELKTYNNGLLRNPILDSTIKLLLYSASFVIIDGILYKCLDLLRKQTGLEFFYFFAVKTQCTTKILRVCT